MSCPKRKLFPIYSDYKAPCYCGQGFGSRRFLKVLKFLLLVLTNGTGVTMVRRQHAHWITEACSRNLVAEVLPASLNPAVDFNICIDHASHTRRELPRGSGRQWTT